MNYSRRVEKKIIMDGKNIIVYYTYYVVTPQPLLMSQTFILKSKTIFNTFSRFSVYLGIGDNNLKQYKHQNTINALTGVDCSLKQCSVRLDIIQFCEFESGLV